MANYTAQEVQTAVEKIIRSSVRFPTGILGERKIEVSFSDLQEAAAGVYILYFNAPFYTLLLGARRLRDLVDTQASTVTSLMDTVSVTDRLVTPISDVSPLANARAALEELEAAVSSRTQGFQSIQQVPAFRRYAQNLETFLGTSGQNVRAGGQIVDTPAGARAQIPALARNLRDQHDELIRRATLLASAMSNFASLNLPRVAAQGVISRARDVLDTHYTTLSELNENERLESLRLVVLDLLTQRPLVEKYGAAVGPSEFIITEGQAAAFSDATHFSTPAQVVATHSGPYNILEAEQFARFTMDGGAPFDYPLPLSFVAELQGTLSEPFNIEADRDTLTIAFGTINMLTTFTVGLTNGLRTAEQVATEINVALAGTDLVCEETFSPLKYKAPVTISSLPGNSARFAILAGSLTGLNILVGDEIDVLEGANAGTTWTVFFVDPLGQYLDAAGSIPVAVVGLPGVDIEVGAAARSLRLRDAAAEDSVNARRLVRLPILGTSQDVTAAILGWAPGSEARSRPVAARDVASNINTSTSRLAAGTVFDAAFYAGRARSVPAAAGQVVLSKFEAEGTITAGTTVTFSSSSPVTGVEIGDQLVVRSSVTSGDVNKSGEVTAVTESTITAFFSSPVTAGGVGIEVGPDITFFQFGAVLNIMDGPNQGRYTAAESIDFTGTLTPTSLEVLLESALPVAKDGDLPIYFNVEFGVESVVFKSRLQQTTSSVRVENAPAFFTSPAEAIGTTPYLQFETYPTGAQLGDLVLFYESQYNEASRTFSITGLEPATGIVKVSPDVESDLSLSFEPTTAVPFGRIRVAQVADFASLQTRTEAWLAQPEQQEIYFRDLARFLNPILSNANPTAAQVNDALNHLRKLLAVLNEAGAAAYGSVHVPAVTEEQTLGYALNNYSAPAQEPVDTLLSTFRYKGADRAIDLLLEGRFSDFFGLSADGVSYSGALVQSLRELAREDLPVRKFNRKDTGGQQLIGTIPNETNFEFNTEDADAADTPDIPVGSDSASPGENF